MQSSIQRMVSDGTLQFIDLAIEYIDKVNVKVSVDDVPIGAPGSGTPYTYEWITDARIKITPVVPLAGIVVLRRATPTLKMYHVYDDGATFNDFTMDENFKQLLFIGQEAIDGGVATDFYSDINMHLYRIKNIGDAVDPRDAIPLAQYQADANGAVVSRTAAEAAAAAALLSQNTATAAATAAWNSQTAAAASATAALSSQNAAASSAGAASTSANSAQASATAADASYYSFDERYLGAKTSNPTLDNDGNALLEGALYWNTVAKEMRVCNGTAWLVAYLPATGYLEKSQNLADLVNASTARSNLGLGTAATATLTTSTTDGTVGSVMKVGDFGLGAGNALISSTDLNALNKTGFYVGANLTNSPSGVGWYYVIHQEHSADGYSSQIVIDLTGLAEKIYTRKQVFGSWTAWKEIALTTSPAFTGTPTAPTATVGTNTTQLANTAFVKATVDAVGKPFTKEYVSAEQAITPGGTITLTHNLGAKYKLCSVVLKCLTSDLGYPVGAQLDMGSRQDYAAYAYGFNTRPVGATAIELKIATSGMYLHTTNGVGTPTAINTTSWSLIVRAWA